MRMLTRTEARLLLREPVALSRGLAMPMVLLAVTRGRTRRRWACPAPAR